MFEQDIGALTNFTKPDIIRWILHEGSLDIDDLNTPLNLVVVIDVWRCDSTHLGILCMEAIDKLGGGFVHLVPDPVNNPILIPIIFDLIIVDVHLTIVIGIIEGAETREVFLFMMIKQVCVIYVIRLMGIDYLCVGDIRDLARNGGYTR